MRKYGMSINSPGDNEAVFKCGLFSCVEYCGAHSACEKYDNAFEVIEKEAEKLLELSKKYNVDVRSVHLPFGESVVKFSPSSLCDEERAKTLENTKKIIEILAPCNVEIVVIHGSLGVEYDVKAKRIDYFVDYLKELCDFCAQYNIKVAVETLKTRCIGNGLSEHLYIMEKVNRKNIGICFDSNHLLEEENTDFIKGAGKYIITTHLSDFDGIDERHWFPGEGIIEWKKLVSALDENGYKGPMVFELSFAGREKNEELYKGIIENFENLIK